MILNIERDIYIRTHSAQHHWHTRCNETKFFEQTELVDGDCVDEESP